MLKLLASLLFISLSAHATSESSLCKILLDSASSTGIKLDLQNAIEKTVANAPAKIDVLIKINADGAASFDPNYNDFRRKQLMSLYNYTRDRVSGFDMVAYDTLKRESQAMATQLSAYHSEVFATELAMLKMKKQNNLEAFIGLVDYIDRLADIKDPNKEKERLRVEHERARLLQNPELKTQFENYQKLADLRTKQWQVHNDLQKTYSANSRKLKHLSQLMPSPWQIIVAKTPPRETETLLDYILRVAGAQDPRGVLSLISGDADLMGVFLAELRVKYGKEYQLILASIQNKQIQQQLTEIQELKAKVESLSAQVQTLSTQKELANDTTELTKKERAMYAAIAALQTGKIGWWSFIIISVATDIVINHFMR